MVEEDHEKGQLKLDTGGSLGNGRREQNSRRQRLECKRFTRVCFRRNKKGQRKRISNSEQANIEIEKKQTDRNGEATPCRGAEGIHDNGQIRPVERRSLSTTT